jgi:hypothetical protein
MARVRALRDVELPSPDDGIEGVIKFLRHQQDAVGDSIAVLTEVPLLDFTWKRDVVLAAGDNAVGHGLGRSWRGYIVTRKNAAISEFAPDEQPMRDRLLTLTASGAAVVDLFVF